MKKFKMLVGAILVGALLVGCGESEITKVDKAVEESDVVESSGDDGVKEDQLEEAIEEVANLDLTIGDTVLFDGLEVTLNSVHTSKGKEFFEPENAYYIVLNVSIENTTDKSEHISSLMNFKLYDAEGYSQDIGIFADTRGSLDGEIGAGRSMRGEIAFDAYESDMYEFIFENPFTSGQAIFTFKASEME